jgi:hypothetical protein
MYDGVRASAWCCRVLSLDPLHEQIARIIFALPEAGQVALAGRGAMLAHDLVCGDLIYMSQWVLATPADARGVQMAAPVLAAWVGSARWSGTPWIVRRRRVRRELPVGSSDNWAGG